MNRERIYFKKVSEEDCELIFSWANDSETRRNSFNSEKIDYETHKKWFEKKLMDTEFYYILKFYDEPVGQVRMDHIPEGYVVSYSIDYRHRGNGYGKRILELLEQKVSEDGRGKVLIAYVKSDNIISAGIFESLKYNKTCENNQVKFVKRI